jgi:predicted Zn-dependent protease
MAVAALRPGRWAILARLTAALGLALALAGCSENPASGRRQFAVVPDRQLSQMADMAWADMVRQVPVSRDPQSLARVERIGRRLAAQAGREDLTWRYAVIARPEVNAFVLPNGRIAVFQGLLELARDDDELASVIAHEIGHVLARHPSERASQQLAVQAGLGVVQAVISGSEDYGQYAREITGALGMGAQFGVLLPYSRRHELEADRLGVQLMRKAGYDPRAAVSFFERMARVQARQGQPPEILSTHPADQRRIAVLREAIAASA